MDEDQFRRELEYLEVDARIKARIVALRRQVVILVLIGMMIGVVIAVAASLLLAQWIWR
jgi:hypothetical protein